MEVEEQDYTDTGGSGVMVSNLPLLFSRGMPSSLCDMSQSELEVFVPFMVRCSVGEERPVPWSHLPRPPWWPKKLPFRMPPSRNTLISLVERCYTFHGCDYLLQFCGSLVAQMPPSGYRFNDNRDGTTSMYHGVTGKLLVTFRNENRDYDKYRHGGKGRDATKKLLLSPTSAHSGGGGAGGSSGGAMIQPPVTDIYLCDKCENEFYSLKEVQAHERHCCGEVPSSPPTPSPEPDVTEEEPEPTGQVPFLNYFGLRPAQHTGLEPHTSPRKKSTSSPPAKLPGPIYPRYDSIPLTSPLGRYLFAHSKFRNKFQGSQHSVMRYERHLHATPNADINYRERCASRWIVVWRNRKDQQPWVHLYTYNSAQRRERLITIETGLNRRSRRLVKVCRPLKVRVKRLPKRTVDRLKRLGGPATAAPCIDLTDEHHHLEVGGHLVAQQPLSLVGGQNPMRQDNLQFQWVTGLPPQSSSVCVPSSSSSGSLAQHFPTAQLGLHNMVNLSVGHHASFNLIPLVMGSRPPQQHHQQPLQPSGLTLQPCGGGSPRPFLPQVSISSYLKPSQNPGLQQGEAGHHQYSLPADISIRPVMAPTRTQLEADLMKPLSRKKFPGHLGSTITARPAIASPATQPLPLRPPPPPDWERVGSGQGNNNLPHALTSSSIEVIDLSSDEDDYGRGGRGRSEAANAPQQLDGLACYPHTGAKVPSESSEYSLSKNGSSHWSSQQKSHCGAGRVGDLATNGQPPNVLPITPAPCCLQGPQAKGNSRKRKNQEDNPPPPPCGGKTFILDISNQGGIVSQGECPLDPSASTSPDLGLPQRKGLRATEEAMVPPTSLPHRSTTTTTTRASQCSDSLITDGDKGLKTVLQIDEDISFSLPRAVLQESGSLFLKEGPASSPHQDVGPGMKFLTSLMAKGMELFKSLVNKESKTVGSMGVLADLESHQGVRHVPSSPKKNLEVQKLLGDECRELRRGGLRELSHLDPQGMRLTRKAVGRILPSRKTLRPRLRENRPPCRSGGKARREEGRETHREAMSNGPLGVKAPAALTIDENGNSASYVQASPKHPSTTGSSPDPPMGRVHSSREPVPEAVREWKEGAADFLSSLKHSDKPSSDNVLEKSTVFSELSVRYCKTLENSCSGVRTNNVTENCSTGVKTKESPIKSVTEKSDLYPGRTKVQVSCEEQEVCGSRGSASPGVKVTPWAAHNGTTSVDAIKKVTSSPGRGRLLPSHRQTELMGETAEECGAQLALCPLPDQLQHHPGSSGTPVEGSPSRSRITLLNSIRKEASPSGKHSPAPDQESQLYLCSPDKPQSTNRRKRGKLYRELMNLGCDEWKEIQGSGFHPSDLVGQEEVKYLSVSSDEEEIPSSFHSPSPSPTPPMRESSSKDSQPVVCAKVSREVAKLLRDECKELRGPLGRSSKPHLNKNKKRMRWRSMHPLATLTQSKVVEDDLEACAAPNRCSTRSQINSHSLVEVFTPRDSHRHLLRSEMAMCVLNYELPNIH